MNAEKDKMKDEEIKKSILKRLYTGVFESNVKDFVNLDNFAKKIKIDNERIWRIYDQLEEEDLVEVYGMGGFIKITSSGILWCENNKVPNPELVQHQREVRTKL